MSVIELSEEEAHAFAWGDLEGYTEVECIVDHESMYKDCAPAETICKRDSDGTCWSLSWDKYMSHYGSGDHMYHDTRITQVVSTTVTRTITETVWEPV